MWSIRGEAWSSRGEVGPVGVRCGSVGVRRGPVGVRRGPVRVLCGPVGRGEAQRASSNIVTKRIKFLILDFFSNSNRFFSTKIIFNL